MALPNMIGNRTSGLNVCKYAITTNRIVIKVQYRVPCMYGWMEWMEWMDGWQMAK